MFAAISKGFARARSGLVFGGLAAAIGLVVHSVDAFYPVQDWLFVRYATYGLLSAYFGVGCLVLGHALLRVALGRVLPVREQFAVSLPLGLLAYFTIAFVAGLLGLFGTPFFVATPLLMLAFGARSSLRYARRLVRHVRYARRVSRGVHRTATQMLVTTLGMASLGLIYFSIMSPLNASYDARWYHIPLAEQYASSGRIFRFDEGWVFGAYPQLASLIYTWAHMLPYGLVFDRLELSAHLEFLAFLWTLVAVPALARRLLPRAFRAAVGKPPRLHHTWAAMFLFPGIFLYDSSLNLGADHVAALFTIPIALMLLQAWPRLAVRECCVLSALLAGALLTKYTAILVVAPALLALVLRTLMLSAAWLRGRARSPWPGPLYSALLGLLLTSPHWLKNWFWYGDPVFPLLQDKLTLRPWLREAATPYYADIAVAWHAAHDWAGLRESLRIAFTFAFKHHDMAELHGPAPLFGFLFTVSLCFLPFLGKAPRLWGVYLAVHFSVVMWALISWQDRYLQILVPCMAAAVVAAFTVVWRLHRLTRIALCVLVALQAVWGSDAYFFATHRMIGTTPAKLSIDLLNTARENKIASRYALFEPFQSIDATLPRGAKVLVHAARLTIGLSRPRVDDGPGTQGGIVYSRFASARGVHDALRALGVTHILWSETSEATDSLAADFIFYDFVRQYLRVPERFGSMDLSQMPRAPPPATPFGQNVAYLACRGRYSPLGMYRLDQLNLSVYGKAKLPKPIEALSDKLGVDELVQRADYVALQTSCDYGITSAMFADFVLLTTRGGSLLYARKHHR